MTITRNKSENFLDEFNKLEEVPSGRGPISGDRERRCTCSDDLQTPGTKMREMNEQPTYIRNYIIIQSANVNEIGQHGASFFRQQPTILSIQIVTDPFIMFVFPPASSPYGIFLNKLTVNRLMNCPQFVIQKS